MQPSCSLASLQSWCSFLNMGRCSSDGSCYANPEVYVPLFFKVDAACESNCIPLETKVDAACEVNEKGIKR